MEGLASESEPGVGAGSSLHSIAKCTIDDGMKIQLTILPFAPRSCAHGAFALADNKAV